MTHTLLLADDSVTIQRVIELTFADEDIRVVAVGDGDQAIAMLAGTPPDIVLADVGMPGRNGYEVARHIRDTAHLSHIPVLLLTGAFEPIDQEKAAAVGCDGVLAKPFEPQLVIGRVKELLARPRPVPAPAGSGPEPAAPRAALADEATPVVALVKTSDQSEVDHYFDRLDQAFANLSNVNPPEAPRSDSASVAKEIDWFAAAPAPAAPGVPEVVAAVATDSSAVASGLGGPVAPPPPRPDRWVDDLPLAAPPHEPLPPNVPLVDAPDRTPVPRPPSLADAFAALLAAEQSLPPPPASPRPSSQPAVVSDDAVEAVVRRVLERLTDRVVRETVADIASATTERLVREEIERIKRSIE